MALIFRWLTPYVDALITERILMFHNAMIERGQIPRVTKNSTRPL